MTLLLALQGRTTCFSMQPSNAQFVRRGLGRLGPHGVATVYDGD